MSPSRLAPCLAVLLTAGVAEAHIKLNEPPSFQVTDALGNPQKVGPCGEAGTASNVVTEVLAGSTLTVRWTETIGHPGHFRLGIATDPAHFVTPTAVVMNNDCKSAPIETSPGYPTLVDGLFPHTSAPSGAQHTTTVTVPMMSCERCTLQLLQFMAAHAPPCFYFQCAHLRIVLPDAGVPDAGSGSDAGTGDGGAASDGGAAGGGGGTAGGGGGGTGGGAGMMDAGAGGGGGEAEPGGCSCAGVDALAALAIATLLVARRRRNG
jgi:uncharacterized protein (TIGR03382 family)